MTTLPSWRDTTYGTSRLGTKARVALWLIQEVKENGTFTKADLRAAFPDVAQIDRRMRDLRDHGWEIATSREDPTLRQQEHRFRTRGADVWIPGQAKAPVHKGSITNAQRAKVFQDDGHLCRICGVTGGETYRDGGLEQAVLNVARRPVIQLDGSVEHQLVTECQRCGRGNVDRTVDMADVLAEIESLAPVERRVIRGWIAADRRNHSALEKLWGRYRTLPEDARRVVAEKLDGTDD
ncbi:hypothetical protein ACFV83_20305 [Streptomyces pharetrae]|jgi:5-methylcytosine-specific restriction endonuclease McrA|uniref:hypothetical protein n=1 Tax=Streptomyces pharetrae TaxID=291370 RepID=UPI003657DFB4